MQTTVRPESALVVFDAAGGFATLDADFCGADVFLPPPRLTCAALTPSRSASRRVKVARSLIWIQTNGRCSRTGFDDKKAFELKRPKLPRRTAARGARALFDSAGHVVKPHLL